MPARTVGLGGLLTNTDPATPLSLVSPLTASIVCFPAFSLLPDFFHLRFSLCTKNTLVGVLLFGCHQVSLAPLFFLWALPTVLFLPLFLLFGCLYPRFLRGTDALCYFLPHLLPSLVALRYRAGLFLSRTTEVCHVPFARSGARTS